MVSGYGLTIGKWNIRQDRETLEVVLSFCGSVEEKWLENHVLSWEELGNIIAEKSMERGGDK